MNERAIFLEALEKPTPAERAEFLGTACGDDRPLRTRVEALLQSHESAGDFLKKSVVERVAERLSTADEAGETEGELTLPVAPERLEFLTPSQSPGSLGRIGHYEVQEVIGRGGMGIVLRAFDEKLHRVVAIKVMAPQLAASAAARKRFSKEAQAAAAICHDHIVTIHAVDEANGLPYLVMQYIAGVSLQERINRSGALQLQEILRIGMQTAAGLAAAHAQGLIHRDVKPANILLENGVERVKITDFGLARAAADSSTSQSGIIAGTPQYMSPEQARGGAIDRRADLFSLGSVLYAMCTGRSPFRGANSIAVLKRVCEDAPTPIRDSNLEIPDWLVAIVEKLQAKDPAQRYQTAAEVAEILGRRLGELQHPSVAALPAIDKTASPRSAAHSTRWALAAAAVLLCLVVGLGLAEGTGVTKLAATVIRIFTPDGTLVVETGDPGVKVTIEGDGGLIITGAGLEEIRLHPGNYKIHADKNGQNVPLETELVTIARGGNQVVRVRLESAAPRGKNATTEPGPFVVLGGKGLPERKFDTLAEAVLAASSDDTIEVRGNGPFDSGPIDIGGRALTIRAARGCRPVVRMNAEGLLGDQPLVRTTAPLVLEGLELQRLGGTNDVRSRLAVVAVHGASLRMAHCSLAVSRRDNAPEGLQCVNAIDSPHCELQSCVLAGRNTALALRRVPPLSEVLLDNCLITCGNGVVILENSTAPRRLSISLRHSTLLLGEAVVWLWSQADLVKFGPGSDVTKFIQIDARDTILPGVLQFGQTGEKKLPAEEAENALRRQVDWREQRNLYPEGIVLLQLTADYQRIPATRDFKTLEEWQQFWNLKESGSLQGRAKFLGQWDRHFPLRFTPQDFRLRPDSVGYQAGTGGQDLGADVDLVGPGPAYERWKQTPEYQQWLRDSGQTRAESPETESGDFVVLGGKSVEVHKFDTLAEAVQHARTGDTIEIRGNGPYQTKPIAITGQALTLRAGAGFAPIIQMDPVSAENRQPLLTSNAPLVLEGLDFQRVGKGSGDTRNIITATGASLRIANCRFLHLAGLGTPAVIRLQAGECVLRNCQLVCPRGVSLAVQSPPRARFVVENCVNASMLCCSFYQVNEKGSIHGRLSRNTSVTTSEFVFANVGFVPWDSDPSHKPFQITNSGSVFSGSHILHAYQGGLSVSRNQGRTAAELEAWLPTVLGWQDQLNAYDRGGLSVTWHGEPGFTPVPKVVKSPAEWKRYWGDAEGEILEGVVRFRGGDLADRLTTAPEKIIPEDFRLRADSVGYRAGKDGKDLGADVDLVGPGAAYERWKETPEYQQWLKDSGQVK